MVRLSKFIAIPRDSDRKVAAPINTINGSTA
jgi:hypothetical protein